MTTAGERSIDKVVFEPDPARPRRRSRQSATAKPISDIQPEDLTRWWTNFASEHPYRLYGTLLADETDAVAANFFQSREQILSGLSANDCGFLYFRDPKDVKRRRPFLFSEHARWAYALGRVFGCPMRNMPCLVFFEHLGEGDYVAIPLKDQSAEEIIERLRSLFSYVDARPDDAPLQVLRAYRRLLHWQTVGTNVARGLEALGDKLPDIVKTVAGK